MTYVGGAGDGGSHDPDYREAVKKDIGGGFFMDDFILEKVL